MADLAAGQIIEHGGKRYLIMGKTFSAKEKLQSFQSHFILECETLNVEYGEDGKISALSAWVPNMIEATQEKADTLEAAIAKAAEHGVLQGKVRHADGTVDYLPTEAGEPSTANKALDLSDEDGLDLEIGEKGVRQLFGSPGGKSRLAKTIVNLIPPHKTYVEPFAGGAAVLFAKPPEMSEKEVLNDADREIADAYRIAKVVSDGEINELAGMNWEASEEKWKALKDSEPSSKIGKLHRFLYLNAYSKGDRQSYRHLYDNSVTSVSDRLPLIKERLRDVEILNQDYEGILSWFDSPDTFFYLDPPFPNTSSLSEWDFDAERFEKTLKGLKGKALISWSPKSPKLNLAGWSTKRVSVQRSDQDRSEDTELLIANYPLPARIARKEAGGNMEASSDGKMRAQKDSVAVAASTKNLNEGDENGSQEQAEKREQEKRQNKEALQEATGEAGRGRKAQGGAAASAGTEASLADYPDESQKLRFVVQAHFRGRSAHLDLRFEYKRGNVNHLVGFTVFVQQPGAITEPVTTMAQARSWAAKPKVWKMSLQTGEILARQTRAGVRKGDLRAVPKASEIPEDWLWEQGVTNRAEPGEPIPAGATKNFPGVFLIIEQGEVEWGASKPWFREWWLHGTKAGWQGRWLFRLIPRGAKAEGESGGVEWADEAFDWLLALDELGEADWDLWRAASKAAQVEGILPPGQEEDTAIAGGYWVLMQPDEQKPYSLLEEAISKGWLPPRGVSCLPRAIRKSVPAQMRYWEMSGQAAQDARNELAQMEEVGGPGISHKEQGWPCAPGPGARGWLPGRVIWVGDSITV